MPDQRLLTLLQAPADETRGRGPALRLREGSGTSLCGGATEEETVRPSVRRGAFAFALLGVVIVAGADAQTTSPADDDTTGSLGPTASARMLPLSDEQRGRIYDGIMRMSNATQVDAPPPAPAEALPHSVPLQDLPGSVERDIPLVKGHKFVKLDDRILVVNPASRKVVVFIPRYKIMLH